MPWNFIPVNGPYGGTTEGPVWDGKSILFTFIPGSVIQKFDPVTSSSTTFREGTNHANGLAFDSAGRLYACEGGARRVVRYDGDDDCSSSSTPVRSVVFFTPATVFGCF